VPGRSGRRWTLVALAALAVVAIAVAGVTAKDDAKPRPRPPNRFGIAEGGLLQALPRRDLARVLDGVRAIGATWIRVDVNWAVIQARGRRSYAWSPFDRVVRSARARGLNVLGGIVYTPRWAEPSGGKASSPPAHLGDYATFAGRAAKHFGRLGVHAYEIWNEPNNGDSWEPSPDPVRYTKMLRLASAAIKSADHEATVISGGLSPYGSYGERTARFVNPLDFLEAMYANGARDALDGVGWHPYSFPLGLSFSPRSAWSQMSETVPSARSIMRANGDGAKRIWATEFGAPTGESSKALTEAAQAALVREAYTKLKAWRWAGPAFLYSYRDHGAVDPGASPDGGFGLVRSDWSKKPSYEAYARLTRAR
jgi:hypothetical protein